MNKMRLHHLFRLQAISGFYAERLAAAPESERANIKARLLALDAACVLPASELRTMLYLERRHGHTKSFSRVTRSVVHCAAVSPLRSVF